MENKKEEIDLFTRTEAERQEAMRRRRKRLGGTESTEKDLRTRKNNQKVTKAPSHGKGSTTVGTSVEKDDKEASGKRPPSHYPVISPNTLDKTTDEPPDNGVAPRPKSRTGSTPPNKQAFNISEVTPTFTPALEDQRNQTIASRKDSTGEEGYTIANLQDEEITPPRKNTAKTTSGLTNDKRTNGAKKTPTNEHEKDKEEKANNDEIKQFEHRLDRDVGQAFYFDPSVIGPYYKHDWLNDETASDPNGNLCVAHCNFTETSFVEVYQRDFWDMSTVQAFVVILAFAYSDS